MKQIQGIVMNVTEKGIVAMGSDGVFYRIPPQGNVPLIGEEILIPISVTKQTNQTNRFWKLASQKMRKWSIAAAVLLVLVTSALIYPLTPEAAYVVALDINPSLEMYMNDKNQVMKVTSLDDEAKELVKELDLKGLTLKEAMERLTLTAEEKGYFPSPDTRVFATVIQWNSKLEAEALEMEVEEAIHQLTLGEKVVVSSVDKDVWKEAHKEKLPVAKYQITQELEKEGIELDKDQITNESVDQLLKKYQLDSDILEKKKDKEDKDPKGKEQGDKKGKKDSKIIDETNRKDKEKQKEDSDKTNENEGEGKKKTGERENTKNGRDKDKENNKENEKDNDKEKDKHREEAQEDDDSEKKDNPGASKKREIDGQKDEDSAKNDRVEEKDKDKENDREQDKKNKNEDNDAEKEDKDK